MRWFIGVLVLANLAIFAWSSLQQRPSEDAELAQPGVGNIRLLREVDSAPGTGDVDDEGAAETKAAEAPAAIELAEQAEQPPVPEPEPIVEPDQVPPVAEPPPPAEPVMVCGRLGEFADLVVARQFLKQLQDRGIEAELGSGATKGPSGYWALIPAAEDRQAGKKKLAELKAAGIQDVWLFAKGPLKNAISLGLFSSEKNAQRRVAQVAKAGFKPVVQPKAGKVGHHWIDYRAEEGVSVLTSDLPQVKKLRDRLRDCPQAQPADVE